MSGRPPWNELAEVRSGELVIRLIRPDAYVATARPGSRVQPAALPTNERTPSATSYGASAFVKSLLRGGTADLLAANPKWVAFLQAEVLVEHIRALGIDVRLSPQDCEFDRVRDAHASLINVDRPRRNQLIRLLEQNLVAAGE